MEIVGQDEKVPKFNQYMTTLNTWGPEYEVRLQVKFNNEPTDAPWTKNVFRFTIFNSIYDSDESGSNIPAMWIQGRGDPLNFIMATSIDNQLENWAPLWNKVIVGKYYDIIMKQYRGKVNMFILSSGLVD